MSALAPEPAPRRLPVPRRRRDPRTLATGAAVLAVLAALHVAAWIGAEMDLGMLAEGWHGMVRFVSEAVPPDLAWDPVVKDGLKACLVTLWIGLLGTTLSIPFTIALSVLGSRATNGNAAVYQAARGVLSFLRAVPDVVFALVFVTAVGLGPFAGVLALVCNNTGVMGKLWAEAMEEVDDGPAQALRIAGARRTQLVAHAVLPACLPQLVGLVLYRLDVNVRASLVLGLVGAGGIGFLINQSIQEFRFDQMLTYILMVLVLVVAVDVLSSLVRRRLAP
ncbi:phosphonate ABC transporter, permease protein PhnE [Actinomadura parmotrematis]|uniref:Phosphonate ABC transporter, permease protein PhnE n=1 Tax=Actinomadura parmotrematis TaxID=2864039 RepID=A0ABS7FQQ3_9ACTN|nr:phosphonate ABC transporter, permease protein PhnE [Actinomadura parmotrematis]MBW8482729.1 phosphonate ABC transporter, permease protein PhnE [Actinomadura parmotrematis]